MSGCLSNNLDISELVQEIGRGDCVLFIGAGLLTDAGLPSWKKLLSPLCKEIGCSPDIDPLKIAQVFEFRKSRRILIDNILERTDTTGKEVPENLKKLAKLGINTWVTTNYDNFIEKALEREGWKYVKVISDQGLPFIRADRTTLVKLHGDREQQDSIVITKQDFYEYFHKRPGIKDKMSQLLMEKTFLFIGYSHNDPDLEQVHREIAFRLKRFQRKAYAVLFDADDITVDDLRSRNINVINLSTTTKGPSACLSEFLDQLINELSLSANVPRKEYYGSEAKEKVTPEVIKKFKKEGKQLYRCVKYLIRSPLDDVGQYNWPRPDWRPPESKSPDAVSYTRIDNEGNIWWGFAFGK